MEQRRNETREGKRGAVDRGCEDGPSNGINPRPVNPFIGAANPATGHERGCLLDPDSRPDIQRDGDQDTNPSISKSLPRLRGLTIPITVL